MVTIEVFADVWCPFAHVGLWTIRQRTQEQGWHEPALRIRAWPLELINGRPQDAETTAAHIRELREQISSELFAGFDQDNFPSRTLPALAVAASGYRQSISAGESISFALRNALFEEGRDISDLEVLNDVAARNGVHPAEERDRENVLNDWRQGQIRGVKGSPHFFCGTSDVFCPSLDIASSGEGRLRIHRNREALDAFLSGCLGD